MHPGSGGLSNGPIVSERPCAFAGANPRGHSEDVWATDVRPPVGQVASGHSSRGIGAPVGIHPPAHVPGRGMCGMYCIGKSGEEVTFSNGEINWAE